MLSAASNALGPPIVGVPVPPRKGRLNFLYPWVIFNTNSLAMANGAEFFVVLDAGQVFDCTDLIFEDGFQA